MTSRDLIGQAFSVDRDAGKFLLVTQTGVLPVTAAPEMLRDVADSDVVTIEVAADEAGAGTAGHCL